MGRLRLEKTSPRIEDVAACAGVSSATVSRVLNGKTVRDTSRQAVEAAVALLKYKPNIHARSLMTRRSYSVGVIIPSFSNPFYDEVIRGIVDRISSNELTVLIGNSDDNWKSELKTVKTFADRRVDGLIAMDSPAENIKSGFLESIATEIPFVMINGDGNVPSACSVGVEHYEAGQIALEYIVATRPRKVLLVRGASGYPVERKEAAFYDLKKAGRIVPEGSNVLYIKDANQSSAISTVQSKARKLFLSDGPPEAVFACNDMLAVGIIKAAIDLGIKVPEELVVIGSGNSMIAEIAPIPLTSVDTRGRDLGDIAARIILDIIDGTNVLMDKVTLTPRLVLRESSRGI